MDRLMDIWDSMVTWYMAHGEEPLFNLVQGIILGATVVGAIRILVAAYRVDKAIKEIEGDEVDEDERDD